MRIGSTPASTSPDMRNDYTFLDINPFSGKSFYRLKQIDQDGQFSYSEIISVHNASSSIFTVFYSPSSNQLNIHTNEYENQELVLEQIDGKKMILTKIRRGSNSIQLPSLATGIYIVRITSNQKLLYVHKLFVSR